MKKNQTQAISAEKYRVKTEKGYQKVYRFPFEVMDKTPNGSNLGRIEWCVELFRAKHKKDNRYYIEKIWVWARQTRDTRYQGKTFEIPCWLEMIESFSSDISKRRKYGEASYMSRVWQTYFCPEHKQLAFSAYPQDWHNVLEIDVSLSVMGSIDFKVDLKTKSLKSLQAIMTSIEKVSPLKMPAFVNSIITK